MVDRCCSRIIYPEKTAVKNISYDIVIGLSCLFCDRQVVGKVHSAKQTTRLGLGKDHVMMSGFGVFVISCLIL